MAENNDPTRLAQEFLALWQREMTKAITDPDAIKAMLGAMQAFYPAGENHDASPRRASPAPDAGDDAIRQLSNRMAKLEREFGKLHTLVATATKKPTAKAKRGNVKRVAKPERSGKRGTKKLAKRSPARRPKSKPRRR